MSERTRRVERCAYCGGPMPERRRADATYCSGCCRTAASRERARTLGEGVEAVVAVTRPLVGVTGTTTTRAPAPPTSGPVGGPCPDPERCRHRWRYPTGPWTCAANHPHDDRSAPTGRSR